VHAAPDTEFGVLKLTLHHESYNWHFLAANVPGQANTFIDSGTASCHGPSGD
jgi:hypothetical protein